MSVGVFLQARIGSCRLHRKVLLPLSGEVVIVHAMRSLKNIPAEVHAVLTDEQSSSILRPYVEAEGFALIVGDSDDVLSRFAHGIHSTGVDVVIRATADNPLVSSEIAMKTLQDLYTRNLDYCRPAGAAIGTGVEIALASALLRAYDEAQDRYDREHVCPYLYHNPQLFRTGIYQVAQDLCIQGRVTLDTKEDYEVLQKIFSYNNGVPMKIEELVAYLQKTQHEYISWSEYPVASCSN